MTVSVTMPRLGESVTEGTVSRWLKQEGERVEVDEPLLEVSTDKVDTEVPSPAAGILTSIKVAEDETVDIGVELAVITDGRRRCRLRRRGSASERRAGDCTRQAATGWETSREPADDRTAADEPEPEPESPSRRRRPNPSRRPARRRAAGPHLRLRRRPHPRRGTSGRCAGRRRRRPPPQPARRVRRRRRDRRRLRHAAGPQAGQRARRGPERADRHRRGWPDPQVRRPGAPPHAKRGRSGTGCSGSRRRSAAPPAASPAPAPRRLRQPRRRRHPPRLRAAHRRPLRRRRARPRRTAPSHAQCRSRPNREAVPASRR